MISKETASDRCIARICFVADTPSSTGMCMSIRITSNVPGGLPQNKSTATCPDKGGGDERSSDKAF